MRAASQALKVREDQLRWVAAALQRALAFHLASPPFNILERATTLERTLAVAVHRVLEELAQLRRQATTALVTDGIPAGPVAQ